jgi:hypothetical protein
MSKSSKVIKLSERLDERAFNATSTFTAEHSGTLDAGQLSAFHDVIRVGMEACVIAARGDARSSEHAFLSFVATLRSCVDGYVSAIEASESDAQIARMDADELRAKTRELQDAIDAAQRSTRTSIDAAKKSALSAVAERERRIVSLEALARTSSSGILKNITAYVAKLPADLDAALRTLQDCATGFDRLRSSDVDAIASLETIEIPTGSGVVERTLQEEIIALGTEVSVFRGRRRFELTERERHDLDALSKRYDTLRAQYATLIEIVKDTRSQHEALETSFRSATRVCSIQDAELRSALEFLPKILDQDCFALAGTSHEALAQKRGLSATIRSSGQRASMEISRRLTQLRSKYEHTDAALEPVQETLENLLEVTDTTWLDALSEPDRVLTRTMVLACANTPRAVSCKLMAQTLCEAKTVDSAPDRELQNRIFELCSIPCFVPARTGHMQEKMRVFRLTDTGLYWSRVWNASSPKLAKRILDARTLVLSRRRARRTTSTELPVLTATHVDPPTTPEEIVARLSDDARTIAHVFVRLAQDIPNASGHREPWAKCVVAMVQNRAIPHHRSRDIETALREVWLHKPPLMTTITTSGRRTIELTDTARDVAGLLSSLPHELLNRIETTCKEETRWWTERDRQLFQHLQTLVHRLGFPNEPRA